MKIELDNGETVFLDFRHEDVPDDSPEPAFTPASKRTICTISAPGFKEIAFGTSYCLECDNFRKATGRKYALTRALKKAKYPKNIRTTVWKTYLSKSKI